MVSIYSHCFAMSFLAHVQCVCVISIATRGQHNDFSSLYPTQPPLQYLLLCQLLLEGLVVTNGHSLYFLLPLLCFSKPADKPLVAFMVGFHVAPEEVELPLPKVNLSKHSLPALQEAVHQQTVMLELSITLTMDPCHLVIDNCSVLKLVLQAVKYHLVGFCFSMHFLSKRHGDHRERKVTSLVNASRSYTFGDESNAAQYAKYKFKDAH